MTLVTQCATPGCPVWIRYAVGQSGIAECKWCQQGIKYNLNREFDDCGIPDSECPWPWQPDAEVERRIRMPHNQDRFRRHVEKYPGVYDKWLR